MRTTSPDEAEVLGKAADFAIERMRFRHLRSVRRQQVHQVRHESVDEMDLHRIERFRRHRRFADPDAIADPGLALHSRRDGRDDGITAYRHARDDRDAFEEILVRDEGGVISGDDRRPVPQREKANPAFADRRYLAEGGKLRKRWCARGQNAVRGEPPPPGSKVCARQLTKQQGLGTARVDEEVRLNTCAVVQDDGPDPDGLHFNL